ncbi:MAG TPA: metal-sensing transcriptional repressor [Patescibacteria group bacterium]|nr:metal-sensing transcriptional repressor [Patescibacteria group bacterium]
MAKKNIENRINNIIGQLNAIKRMTDEKNSDCTQIIVQLKAIKAATSSLYENYLSTNLNNCLHGNGKKNKALLNSLIKEISKN